MIRESKLIRLLSLVFAFALVAAACGSDGEQSSDDGGTTETTAAGDDGTETTAAGDDGGEPMAGGEIVLGVEQWPECTNPVTSCANASWTQWSSTHHVLPRLMELDVSNVHLAGPALVEAPTLENGGLVSNDDGTFTLTFNMNPDAVWSDGNPITSTDVKFTWQAKVNTTGTLQTAGYDKVTDVDDSDPLTAVVTFSENYAPWPDMFGGTNDFLYPAASLPNWDPADPSTADMANIWNEGITISGGPWISESWTTEQHILVPNTSYWDADRIPLVDRVVMVPREDSDTEVASLQSGEIMAAFPQGFPGAKDRLVSPIETSVGLGTFMEGLWMNQLAPDRNFEITQNLRQALAYSLDRQAIADAAIGTIVDSPTVLNCTGWNPSFGEWCDDTDYAKYVQDQAKVDELLTADGWTRPDPNGLWQKDGQDLVLQWNTVAGNLRRENVQAVVVEMTRPFGIGWEIINYDAGELFSNRLPTLDYGPVALFANSTSPDPSVVALYDIDGVPSEANGFSGQNNGWNFDQNISDLAFAIDLELDPAARLELVRQAGDALSEYVPWIPLYLLPNITAWRGDILTGPIGDFANSAHGGFANMYDWSLAG
jgi:peptide/nickel transport system substrate-binding protein